MTANPRVINGPHLITTAPALVPCRTCQRPQLAATVTGLDRHVDPAPLTPAGELAALLAGRPTYNLAGPNREHLIRRTVHHIHAPRRHPVVADHTCQPPAPGHVDHTWLEVAVALVHHLAGGQPLTDGASDAPPF
jgi:hypothetical protein